MKLNVHLEMQRQRVGKREPLKHSSDYSIDLVDEVREQLISVLNQSGPNSTVDFHYFLK